MKSGTLLPGNNMTIAELQPLTILIWLELEPLDQMVRGSYSRAVSWKESVCFSLLITPIGWLILTNFSLS